MRSSFASQLLPHQVLPLPCPQRLRKRKYQERREFILLMANSFLRRLKRQTSHVLRSSIRSTRLTLTDVTLAQLLAEEATRSKPWPPRDTGTLRLISQRSFEVDDFWRVAEILHKSFADEWQSDREVIRRMCRFEHVDEKGYNWGLTVEMQAERVLQLLEKGTFLKEERVRLRGNGLKRDSDDRLTADEDGAVVGSRRIHQGEELIPLLSCEEGRTIEVLSHQV